MSAAHDNAFGEPDPQRVKVFAGGQELSTDEQVEHLIELVAQLNERLEALEGHVTALVSMSVGQGRRN